MRKRQIYSCLYRCMWAKRPRGHSEFVHSASKLRPSVFCSDQFLKELSGRNYGEWLTVTIWGQPENDFATATRPDFGRHDCSNFCIVRLAGRATGCNAFAGCRPANRRPAPSRSRSSRSQGHAGRGCQDESIWDRDASSIRKIGSLI